VFSHTAHFILAQKRKMQRKNEKGRDAKGEERCGAFLLQRVRRGPEKQQTAAPNGFSLFCNEATSSAEARACDGFFWGWGGGWMEREGTIPG